MKINLRPFGSVGNSPLKSKLLTTFICPFLLLLFLFSCNEKNRIHPDPVELTWDFNPGYEGWSGDFADYPVGEEPLYELVFEHDTLPVPLDQGQRALKLSGKNPNSNLFMFVKKKVTGLDPNTVYYATFTVEFASNIPGLTSNEESPGGLIFIAAGATPVEPLKVSGENNIYSMNIDKCDLNKSGEDMVVIGNFTNDTDQPVYALKNLENEHPFHSVTNEKGELWIIIGIDSGYPLSTTAYINSVKVKFF